MAWAVVKSPVFPSNKPTAVGVELNRAADEQAFMLLNREARRLPDPLSSRDQTRLGQAYAARSEERVGLRILRFLLLWFRRLLRGFVNITGHNMPIFRTCRSLDRSILRAYRSLARLCLFPSPSLASLSSFPSSSLVHWWLPTDSTRKRVCMCACVHAARLNHG
ncbi:hypothetical protein LX32DRAFT_333206 [Colletotrichum zoysiae]|uniref:Uncharacterized protein n=1 Tax=Colletotrichum zoysiae TaxID=1216348 RepID=A0AAD9HLX3_9PEZI|nr:hypothetical protein LX32DRAFT_333206 [Colletotrichum zoysiae]